MLFTREETGTALLSQWRRTGLHSRVYFDYKGHRLIKSAKFVKVDICTLRKCRRHSWYALGIPNLT